MPEPRLHQPSSKVNMQAKFIESRPICQQQFLFWHGREHFCSRGELRCLLDFIFTANTKLLATENNSRHFSAEHYPSIAAKAREII